jgi:hypothetical protein
MSATFFIMAVMLPECNSMYGCPWKKYLIAKPVVVPGSIPIATISIILFFFRLLQSNLHGCGVAGNVYQFRDVAQIHPLAFARIVCFAFANPNWIVINRKKAPSVFNAEQVHVGHLVLVGMPGF